MPSPPDDLITLHDDEPGAADSPAWAPWHVLVVDDDPEVHAATRFVLRGQRLLGRAVELHGAHSAAETATLLAGETEFAVVLLDVVMESPDAGLRLVRTIRDELGLSGVRIILRTGQPGYAPELEVISRYDINDYRTKSELTQTRLITSLISALRSYEQIRRIEASQQGLTQIIHATRDLLSHDGLRRFAGGVLTQLGAFLQLTQQRGLVIISPVAEAGATPTQLQVIAASGPYAAWLNHPAERIEPDAVRHQLTQALAERRNVYSARGCALHCRSQRHRLAVFIDTTGEIDPALRELLEVFSENIALCADNLSLLEQLQHIAFVDALTGLPSRLRLLQQLATVPADVADPADPALLLLDIDDFNNHVETLGPAGSDALLCSLAARLQAQLGALSPVLPVRIGADVFALQGPARLLGPALVAQLCADAFDVHGVPIRLSLSAGLACRHDAPGAAANLIAAAYTALKLAKREQRQGYVTYQPDMGRAALARVALLQALHGGLQAGEFTLALQPQWQLGDAAVVGVEALLRWQPAGGDAVSPTTFIPVAESSGLIVPLGAWVIDEACRQVAEVERRTGVALRLAINVSPAQWRDADLPQRLQQAAERHGLALGRIEIELTESLAMQAIDDLMPRLQALRALGVRVALDDFGTGFSSLAYLQHMPIDVLKIDRSFVHEIGRSRRGEDIARTIVSLAALLGLAVVAEGVETAEQAAFLLGLGCDAGQGHLHAQPMALDALCAWLVRPAPAP
ncbi:MAG: EAL domain-containing protein [Leptothrix sp. (in: b-proteobacteria)]